MAKAKKMTLRQRLRHDADEKIGELEQLVSKAVTDAVEGAGVELNPYDVMRLCTGGQTKSLRERVITELANQKEAELEKIYNDQQDLSFGTEPGDDNA